MYLTADKQERIMMKERVALALAYDVALEGSEDLGIDPNRTWLLFLSRRAEELDCMQAEVTEWTVRAIEAIEKEEG